MTVVIRSRAASLWAGRRLYQRDRRAHPTSRRRNAKRRSSAGIGMNGAGDRRLTGIPVRADVAMTGEITLRAKCCRSAASRRSCWRRIVGQDQTVSSSRMRTSGSGEMPKTSKQNLDIKAGALDR